MNESETRLIHWGPGWDSSSSHSVGAAHRRKDLRYCWFLLKKRDLMTKDIWDPA